MIGTEFEVWVCPECKQCFASAGTQGLDLTTEFNKDIKSNPTIPRSQCQRCSTPSKPVQRVRCIARVIRPWELPRPEMTEEDYYRFTDEQRAKGEARRAGPGHQDLSVRGSSSPAEP